MFGKSLINLSLIAGISSLLVLGCTESKLIFPSSQTIATTIQATKLTNQELETIAQAITVQVHVGEYRGSGILMARDNNTYTVITNAHVVDKGDNYSIETADGIKHIATLISKDAGETVNDLARLEFQASNNYQVAQVGDLTNLTEGEEVLAAGFPFDADKLKITAGKISLLPDKSLEGGYQIGITNETRQGMSGGVLLNFQGKVIGVLGKGKGAIFDTAYTYIDGTTPTAEELERMKDVSFSIPIAKVAEVATQLVSTLSDTTTEQTLSQLPTQPRQYRGIVGTVDNIAEQITVRIDNLTDKSNGSGVIIARVGKSYYVATAKHVLCTNLDTPECEANGQHQVVTADEVIHKLDYQTVQARGTWLDVAVFKFESTNNYSVATLGKYDVGDKWIFVSGFPGINSGNRTQPSRLLTGGLVRKEEEKEFNTKDAYSLKSNGEGLVYTNISYGGMSGGAVLDSQGRLVGINTGAENELEIDDEGNYEQLSLGFSLGVAIQDFLGLVEKDSIDLKPQWLQVETTPTSEITNADIAAIREQLLTTSEPNVEAEVAAWMNYGNQLWRYKRFAEAVNAFKQVLKLEPDFDKAYYGMGLAFLSQKNYALASVTLKKAVEINPAPYYYWRYLGGAYKKLEKYAEAKAAYNTAISKNSEDFVLYVERGDVLSESEDYQGAISSYTQAIKLNLDHPWAYNNLAVVYSELKQYEKAIANYTQALELNPQDAISYYNRGSAYEDLKQYEKAIANYTQALEINPQLAEAYTNRGVAYHNLKQYEKAIADYTQALKINPQLAEAYTNRGVAYHNLQQNEKAITNFSKALKINPNYADAYYNRGVVYSKLQQYEKAIANFTKTIELNPNYADAYYNRAVAYSKLQQYEKAIANFTQAIKINPNYADAYYNRAVAYSKLQQYEKAIANFTQALELNPNYADAYYNRAVAYGFVRNLAQMRQDLQQAAILLQQQNNPQKYQIVQQLLKKLSQLEGQK